MAFSLKSRDYLRDPGRKQYFNRRLFDEVAPKYDFITRALSLGRDGAWKRAVVNALPSLPRPRCVDLACGTGDLALLLAERYPDGDILGLDLTPSMLDRARTRNSRIRFELAEMSRTGLPDASMDIVTGGYALRNAPDLDAALAEVHRILKPGGVAAFLDFSKPARPLFQRINYYVLKLWGGVWGLLLHGSPEVYMYIAESLRHYPDREAMKQKLAAVGLPQVQSRLFFNGLVELFVVRKS